MVKEGQPLFESLAGIEQLEQLCSLLRIEDLAERLEQGGILSRDQFDSVVKELAAPDEAMDVTLIADALIRTDRVSPYQLWAVATGAMERVSLGEYTVVEPLGSGGMGEVLLAVHRRMKRLVAIKFLPARFADDEEMIRRFQREVEVAAQLSHPNIVTAHDAGQQGDVHFLVMEYVDGCDLGTLIQSRGPLPLDDALKCVLQAGRGLVHAHAKGVIHRDIKPSNLLLDRDGNVKVLDMGLARWSSAAADSSARGLSATGVVLGTVDFMAPEQAVSSKNADHRADIYSLGGTLYMLVTGRPIFEGDTVIEKIMAHQSSPIPDLVQEADELDQQLNRVFRRMLAKSPDERFETMQQACTALSECLGDSTTNLHVPPPPRPARNGALQDTQNRRSKAPFASTAKFTEEKEERVPSARPPAAGRGRRITLALVVLLLLAGGAFFGVPLVLKLATPDDVQRSLVLSQIPDNIITVARHGIAHYQTINEAIESAQPGDTIRVLDDAHYPESLSLFSRHSSLQIESPAGATLAATSRDIYSIRLQDVEDVVIRGFKIDMGERYPEGVHVQGNCQGVRLESLRITSRNTNTGSSGVNLIFLESPGPRPAVTVQDCSIEGTFEGVRVSGIHDDYQTFGLCQRVAVIGNRLHNVPKGIVLYGDVRDVLVAGNLVVNSEIAAVQLEQLAPTAKRITLLNNTLANSMCCLRIWSENRHGKDVVAVNNLSLGAKFLDWCYVDNGGTRMQGKGPGDIQRLQADWTTRTNTREGIRPDEQSLPTKAWIPPGPNDALVDTVQLVSRVATDPGFARPVATSALATSGAGGDYPAHVGAIPPADAKPFDWPRLIELLFSSAGGDSNVGSAGEPVEPGNQEHLLGENGT